jgi:hypothetical protein
MWTGIEEKGKAEGEDLPNYGLGELVDRIYRYRFRG